MNSERSIQKKPKFSNAEWNAIETAMQTEGFNHLNDFIVHMVKSRNATADAEIRRSQHLKYQHSNLQTIYNQLRVGINIEQNMQKFIEEAGNLCHELK